MIEVSSTIVNCPQEFVAAFVSNWENDPKWWRNVKESTRFQDGKDHPLGVGARYRQNNVEVGVQFTVEFEVTEFDFPNSIVIESYKTTGVGFKARMVYEPVDANNTRVTMFAEVNFVGVLRLVTPLARAAIFAMSDTFFTNLNAAVMADYQKAQVASV